MLKRAGGQAARARCKTARGVDAAIDRITHGEGSIAELKRHGAGRARCRGTAKLQIQLLLAATAINLKRLTTRLPAAENGRDGDNSRRPRAPRDPQRLPTRARGRSRRDFYDRLLGVVGRRVVVGPPRRLRVARPATCRRRPGSETASER